MAITLTESNAIEKNTGFRDRTRAATSGYTNYLLNTDPEAPDYTAKVQAGTKIAREIEMVMNTLMFTLSGDAEIMAAGPCVPDATLQMIVEKTIAKFYPIQTPPVTLGGPSTQAFLPHRQ